MQGAFWWEERADDCGNSAGQDQSIETAAHLVPALFGRNALLLFHAARRRAGIHGGERTALYPFGFGLSYTQFEYRDLEVDVVDEASCRVDVRVKVRNVGKRVGTETVQLYIDDVQSSTVTPPLLLKDFTRVTLDPGEEKQVCFELDRDAFKLVGVHYRWTVEPGDFRILVGASSRDIRLEKTIILQSEK